MSLLALPHELLQHVARFLPCSSILQLIRVNRQLHEACNDPILFKDVAQNTFYRTPGAVNGLLSLYNQPERIKLQPEQLDWPEGEQILKTSSTEETLRIALAIEELVQLAAIKPATWLLSTTSNMAAWLPHLLALHHPASLSLQPEMFLLPHGQLSQSNTSLTSSLLMNRWMSRTTDQARDRAASAKLQAIHFTNFSFILNYTLLQRLTSTTHPRAVLIPLIQHFLPTNPTLSPSPTWSDGTPDTKAYILSRLSERIPNHGVFIRDFDLVQASSALCFLLTAVAFSYSNSHSEEQTHHHPLLLPAPALIHFPSFMPNLQLSATSAEHFTTSHYASMLTPSFLSGVWHGYYTDHRSFRSREVAVDAPMQGINMVVQEPAEEARTRLRISAVVARESRGCDAHGEFRLSGRVREDGLVSLAKQYVVLGASWTWTGRMTPFAIVGVWGHSSFGGYFWIFKREWGGRG